MSNKIKQDFRFVQSGVVFNPVTIIHIQEYSYNLLFQVFIQKSGQIGYRALI